MSKHLSPADARKKLSHLTRDIFNDKIEELREYLDCAPDNQDYTTAVGNYKNKVRSFRNSTGYALGRWFPNLVKDKAEDSEDSKIRRDFLFIQEYLRGPRPITKHAGALVAVSNFEPDNRTNLFADNKNWDNGLVDYLCDKAYHIPTLGKQINEIAKLHEIINGEGDDETVLLKFSGAIDKISKDSALNMHSSKDNRLLSFMQKVFDIISCIVFPIAIIRSMNSRITHGTWNFFKPETKTFVDEAKEVISSLPPTLKPNYN